MYAELTRQNRSLLKRFSHGSRFKIALQLINPNANDKVLDYGTGDGFMLSLLRSADEHCKLVGYEPVPEMFKELQKTLGQVLTENNIELVYDTKLLNKSFNKICCLEVLEHLTPAQQQSEIIEMGRLLSDDGQIIISVPIEIGLSSLLKNISRILLRQTHKNTNLRTILLSLLCLKFYRGDGPYISSHIGFNYRDLEKILIASNLELKDKVYSPFPILKGLMNSQCFFVLHKTLN